MRGPLFIDNCEIRKTEEQAIDKKLCNMYYLKHKGQC